MAQLVNTRTVLIIDDEPHILEYFQSELAADFKKVFVAENGKAGLEIIRAQHPSLIISDFFMPELNGLEILKTLNEEKLKIPIIWITGYAKSEIQTSAWKSGVYEIIEKPFDLKEIKNAIAGLFGELNDDLKLNHSAVATKVATHYIDLAIEKQIYEPLVQYCSKNNISITSFINQLLEKEIKKAS